METTKKMASFVQNGKLGFKNEKDKIIIEPLYDYVADKYPYRWYFIYTNSVNSIKMNQKNRTL